MQTIGKMKLIAHGRGVTIIWQWQKSTNRVYPYPLGIGSARPNPKRHGRDRKTLYLCIGFTALRGGLRPWSQTIVSEGARPWGRGRSEFAKDKLLQRDMLLELALQIREEESTHRSRSSRRRADERRWGSCSGMEAARNTQAESDSLTRCKEVFAAKPSGWGLCAEVAVACGMLLQRLLDMCPDARGTLSVECKTSLRPQFTAQQQEGWSIWLVLLSCFLLLFKFLALPHCQCIVVQLSIYDRRILGEVLLGNLVSYLGKLNRWFLGLVGSEFSKDTCS